MKNIKRNSILLSSILATAILGAGAVKASEDTTEYAKIAQYNKEGRAGKYDGDSTNGFVVGRPADSGLTHKLTQTKTENKAVSSVWWEYFSDSITAPTGSSTNPTESIKTAGDVNVALNYTLVTNSEGLTINGIVPDQYYTLGVVIENEKHTNGSDTTTFSEMMNAISSSTSSLGSTSVSLLHKNPDNEVTSEDIRNEGFTDYGNFTFSEKTGIQIGIENGKLNVPEEEWHEVFDNDETTLFGASSYDPASHLILYFPVHTNPDDPDPLNSFGATPADGVNSAGGLLYAKAISNKDILSFSGADIGFAKSGSAGYGISIGTLPQYTYRGDWESTVESSMELSYPTPEFTIKPMGYNDRNQFEVDVTYNHVAIPANYDIVSEISYTMMGPVSKDSAPEDEKVVWDQITIDDEKVVREHRTSYDDPTTVIDTYMFDDPSLPEGFKEWNDGDINNGGEYDADGNFVDGGAEAIFGPDYIGDMEIGTDEAIHTTIAYDGLYYGSGQDDLGMQYTFSNSITLAPTLLGHDNAYLLEAPEGEPYVFEYPTVDYIIEPGAASPTIDYFEVTKPEDITQVDPLGGMEVSFSGDTKSKPEDNGVGLKPSFLNQVQVWAQEIDSTGTNVGEEFAISDMMAMDPDQTILNSEDGAFSGTITTHAGALKTNTNYKIYLKAWFGDETYPADGGAQVSTFTKDGEFAEIHTAAYGYREVVVSNNVVSYDEASDVATLTFDYSQILPAINEPDSTIADYEVQEITSVKIVNNAGTENETVVEEIAIPADFDPSVDQSFEITTSAGVLANNKTYNLSVKVDTEKTGSITSNAGDSFVTAPTGPYTPIVGGVTRVNETELPLARFNSDFQFNLQQQTGNGIDVSEYSESNITNINFVLTDGTNELINVNPEIPADDNSDITISGTDIDGNPIVFNSINTYEYTITVDYEGAGPVVKTGTISFALKGMSELEAADVTLTSANSTLTTLGFDVAIEDVDVAAGYDSYYVNSIEVIDGSGSTVDATIQWKDDAGNNIDMPVDSDEGVAFTGQASVFIKNLKYGTDLSTYQLKVNTNSVNLVEGGESFETTYTFNISELMNSNGLINADGNLVDSANPNSEFMDVTPAEISDVKVVDEFLGEESAVFEATLNDEQDVIMANDIIITSGSNVFSTENLNLSVEPITTEMDSREAGAKSFRFTLTGLTPDTTYDSFTLSYKISEQVDFDGTLYTSTMNQTINVEELSITTLPTPIPEPEESSSFPWWIIILILLLLTIVGAVIAVAVLFLLSLRVTSTKDITKDSVTFSLNRDSEFLSKIKGRKLQAKQGENTLQLTYATSINSDGKVDVKVTGLKSKEPLKGITFLKDASEDSKDIKAIGSVKLEAKEDPKKPSSASARKI